MYGGNYRRQEQIEELLRTRPECTPKNPDRSVFDFGLNVKRGGRSDIVVFRITLPSAFPSAPPHIQVLTPNVRHAWIDPAGHITGCTSLYTWNQYSRLAQVVTDVMNQFVSNPPTVGDAGPSPSYYGGNNNNNTSSGGSMYDNSSRRSSIEKPQRRSRNMSDSDDGIFIPTSPDTFPDLDEMDIDRLRELQNDSKKFQEYFKSQPMPTMTIEMRDQIITNNEKQAKANLAYKERIEGLQNKVISLQEEAMSNYRQFKELDERQEVAMRQFDPLRLLTQLESSCNQLDDESELIASEFLNGDVPLQDFLKREMELRTLYHLRRAKAERFRHQLKKG